MEKSKLQSLINRYYLAGNCEAVKLKENAEGIIDSLRLAGSAGQGLFMVDRELGQRVPGPAEE